VTIDRDQPLEIVRKPAARRLRLSVDPRSGTVRLVMPKRAAMGPALDWVKGQQSWIDAQIAKLPDPWPIKPGMIVPLAGSDMILDWSETYPRNPRITGSQIRVGGPLDMCAPRLLRWLRREALTLLTAETREIAAQADVRVGQIGVGDPRSRWGSCAHNGDIRYSWRLILAPTDVRRATIAHEVAHRIHMDHSAAFHAQVERLHGSDPAPARAWLRVNGSRLHWFGRAS
jgi:predicted metal-dependent hydrolase